MSPTASPAPLLIDSLGDMIKTLAIAVEMADLYLNSYDTSAPSRIKATTRAAVEEAMGLLRPHS